MNKNNCTLYQYAIEAAEQALTAEWPTWDDEDTYLGALSGLTAGVKFARWASLYEPGSMKPSKQQQVQAKALVIRLQRRYAMYRAICTEYASDLTTENANEAALDAILEKTEFRHVRQKMPSKASRGIEVTEAEVIAAIQAAAPVVAHEACH